MSYQATITTGDGRQRRIPLRLAKYTHRALVRRWHLRGTGPWSVLTTWTAEPRDRADELPLIEARTRRGTLHRMAAWYLGGAWRDVTRVEITHDGRLVCAAVPR